MKDPYGQEDAATISPKRMCIGLVTLLFALYCMYGMLGYRLDQAMTALIPPYSNRIAMVGEGMGRAETGHTIIVDDFDAAVARARKENKLLLVNFTGFV
jgi:hypothetical protein